MSVEVAAREGVAETPDLKKRLERAKAWVDNPDPSARLKFRRWLGKVLEEVLVTDALTLYPLHDRGGSFTDPAGNPYGLRQLDGATIVPLVDVLGAPPLPPATAFYQVIHGIVETHFELGRLWYLPRNLSPDSPYGRSPTEWVLITVNIALRSQLYDLAYFTSGTIPEGLFSITAQWSQQQINTYQENFDTMLEGRDDARRRLRFVPSGEFHDTKARQWDYEFQEWLGRVISWAFGVSPMPIAKIMNRATAEMQEVSAIESGVRPLAEFLEDAMNDYIAGPLESPDIEAHFGADETEDPATVYQRNVAYINAGVRSVESVRKEIGEASPEGEEEVPAFVMTPAGPVFLQDLLAQKEAAEQQDQARIDPRLIQRAFLEVPFMTRDELRASLGLPSVGGALGAEYVVIEKTPIGAAPGPPTGETPPTKAEPKQAKDDTDSDADVALFGDTPERELARWRSFAMTRVARGRPMRKFQTSALPVRDRARIEVGLRRLYRPDLGVIPAPEKVRVLFDLGKLDFQEVPPASLEGPAQSVRSLVARWIGDHRDALVAGALEELPEETITGKLARLWPGRMHKKLADVDLSMDDLIEDMTAALQRAVKAGSDDTIAIGGFDFSLDSLPEQAVTYAKQRAGELVVEIPQKLMEDIRAKVTTAIAEGWSTDKLAVALVDGTITPGRAERIARTETGFAYNEGAADVYEAAGQEHVEVLDGGGCLPEGHDDTAGEPELVVGIVQDDRLANGQVWTIAQMRQNRLGHPNCVRAFIPYEKGA